MDLTISSRRQRTYTGTQKPTPPPELPPTDPAYHATIEGLRKEIEDLALQLDKGLQVMEKLEAADDPRWAEARRKWRLIEGQYRKAYAQLEAVQGNQTLWCPNCHPGERLPPSARLCPTHARELLAWRARLRGA